MLGLLPVWWQVMLNSPWAEDKQILKAYMLTIFASNEGRLERKYYQGMV